MYVVDVTRNTQTGLLADWSELAVRWSDLISLSSDPSKIGHELISFGHRVGSSSPDQIEESL